MAVSKRESLPARHELKYYINSAEIAALRMRLFPVMELDSHCRKGPYAIRSLYFDDAYDSAYYDKQMGVMHRDKYRIRIYNNSDEVIFLERKRKLGDLIQKSSVRITRRLAERLIEGDPRGLHTSQNELMQDMFVQMRTKMLRPKVIVDYMREAWVHPVEDVRITLDMQLKTGLSSVDIFNPNILTVSPHDRDVEILEVKYNRAMPAHITGLLHGLNAERSAISKYVICRKFEPLK